MLTSELIAKKRDGHELSDAEIAQLVRGITDKSLTEGQVAAFAMAVYFKGLTVDERVALTEEMRDSGLTELLFIISPGKEMIRAYFGDGSRWGVRCSKSTKVRSSSKTARPPSCAPIPRAPR